MLIRAPLIIAMKVELHNSRAKRNLVVTLSGSYSKCGVAKPRAAALHGGWTEQAPRAATV